MPPRRSSSEATGAEEQRAFAFPQIPLALVLHIFSLLPADLRLRCAEVCRGWRATVALPALWRRLDLSDTSGVTRTTPALMHAAVARASSALTVLDLSFEAFDAPNELCAALCASSAVQEIHLTRWQLYVNEVTAMVAAAPQLRELHAAIMCESDATDAAAALLEGRAPFAPLRLQELVLNGHEARPNAVLPSAVALALADARLQPDLTSVRLSSVNLRAALEFDALADAVVARPRLTKLIFEGCELPHAAAPVLARALRGSALAHLELDSVTSFLDVAGGAALLGDALHATSTLTVLVLRQLIEPAASLTPILRSLVGHRSLRVLDLGGTSLGDATAAAALAALLAADAPALTELVLEFCFMGEAGLGQLCDALRRNSHLRLLDIRDNDVPAAFFRDRLLPAVCANTSLRELRLYGTSLGDDDEDDEAALEAALEAEQEAKRIFAAR